MLGEFLVEGVIDEAKVGARCFKQTIRHLVRPFSPFPIRDVDEDWIYVGVSYAFPSARVDPGSGVIGIYAFRRIAIIQIGDDVGGIHDDNVFIDQDRHFNASINRLSASWLDLSSPSTAS